MCFVHIELLFQSLILKFDVCINRQVKNAGLVA